MRFGEHPPTATGRIVNGHDGWQLPGYGLKNEVGHQVDHLAGGEVFACFLVVFFVEFADEFFKDIAHAQVAQGREFAAIGIGFFKRGQVDAGGSEFFEYVQQNVLSGHVAHLAFEFELLDDLLHVGTEAIQVVFKVGLQDLLVVGGGIFQQLQGPLAGVVEYVAAGLT